MGRMPHVDDLLMKPQMLKIRIRELEAELTVARKRAEDAEEAAAIARKAARDAWTTVRTMGASGLLWR